MDPHPLGRTVRAAANTCFTLLLRNTHPIHFDHKYAAVGRFDVHTGGVACQLMIDITQNVMTNLDWDEVRLPNLVFAGDTIYACSKVRSKCELKSRPNVGTVTVKPTKFNQDGKIAMTFKRDFMVGNVPPEIKAPGA